MQVKSGTPHLLPDLTGTSSCAAYNFRRTARAVSRLYDRALEPAGLRSTQFAILTAIAKLEPVAISRVGQILVIDPATMTRNLRLLEKQGLVEISPRGVRRQRLLNLTCKAEKVLAVAVPLWREAQARFLAALGSLGWKEFKANLQQATQAAISLETDASPASSGARPGLSEEPSSG